MSGVYKVLHEDPTVDFRLLVGGAHLSPRFGRSVQLVYREGLHVLGEIESLVDGDAPRSRLKTAAIFLQSAVDMVSNWNPDLIIFAGDREEVLVGGLLGTYLHIPTVHFFGGDHELDGHADTRIRHATSKLATAHVVAIEEHKRRLIAMGEEPERIFVCGSVALDKFVQVASLSNEELRSRMPSGKVLDGYALLIYHPVDGEEHLAGLHFESIVQALKAHRIPIVGSYPNSDPGNSAILEAIYRHEQEPGCWFFKNLDRQWFLSLYRGASFIIGNSSSGILEAASIPLPAINVGTRQRGRLAGENVIFCDSDREDIGRAIELASRPSFRESIARMQNPYGDGHSVLRAYDYLKRTDFQSMRPKVRDPLSLAGQQPSATGHG
jgi:UDP-hydrolysing UDP-N-acetyl-D-glucosamine 2-epimerase